LLLFLTIPIHAKYVEKEAEKQFLNTLEFDILYAQTLAITSTDKIEILFRDSQYVISREKNGRSNILRTIEFPAEWEIDMNVIEIIRFNQTGTFKSPGSMRIKAKHGSYTIVFPLGKGRAYVKE